MDVEAKGGVSQFQAEQRLKEDFKDKLEAAFSKAGSPGELAGSYPPGPGSR